MLSKKKTEKYITLDLGFGMKKEKCWLMMKFINGKDGRMVLNTVLATIPLFFGNCPNNALLVEGSDSSDHDFEQYVPGPFYTSVLIFKKK